MTRGVVERWRAAVYRDRALPDAPRVLALLLADQMDNRGHVQVSRERLAELLGVHLTRVRERLAALRQAGYLDRVDRPAPGRPAVWAATVPTGRGPAVPDRERGPVQADHVRDAQPDHVRPTMWDGTPAEPGQNGRRGPAEPDRVLIPERVYCTGHPAPSVGALLPEHGSTAKDGTSRPAAAVDPATYQARGGAT